MKRTFFILTILLLVISNGFSQSFVSPIAFEDNEQNQEKVISYIKKATKDFYSEGGITDSITLLTEEKSQLKSFKLLTTASDTSLLRTVIETWAKMGNQSYNTIYLDYVNKRKAQKESLKY